MFGRITFGDSESVNPILKGNQTEELFNDIFSSLENFCNSVSSATGIAEIADSAKQMNKEISKLKNNNLPNIKSDMVFIGENFSDEITEVTEVDGSSEAIVSGGVRG